MVKAFRYAFWIAAVVALVGYWLGYSCVYLPTIWVAAIVVILGSVRVCTSGN